MMQGSSPLHRAFAQLAALSCAGCVVSEFDQAPIEVTCAVGVIRGHNQADVEQLARLAERLDPQVAEIIRPRLAEPVRIVLVPPRDDQPSEATCVTTGTTGAWRRQFIAIRTASGAASYLLAHELVHWHADWAWDHLPIAIEEGLAELVASNLIVEQGAVRDAFLSRFGELPSQDVQRLLEVDRGTERGLDLRSRQMLYWVGKNAARRIGVERLRLWCEQAAADGSGPLPAERFIAPIPP